MYIIIFLLKVKKKKRGGKKKKKKEEMVYKDNFVTQKPVSQVTIPATQSICPIVSDSQMELFEETLLSKKGKEMPSDIPTTLKGKQKKDKDIFITQLPVSQMSILPSQNEEDYELTNKQTVSIDLSLVDKTLSETSTNDSMRKDLSNDSSIIVCNVNKNDNTDLKLDKNNSGKNIRNKTKEGKKRLSLEKGEEISIVHEAGNNKRVTTPNKEIINEDDLASQVIPFPTTKRTTLSMSAAKKSKLVKDKEKTPIKTKTSPKKKNGYLIEGKSNFSRKVCT